MSTPDARLSAAERAALADLEAAAAAHDPSLADRLRGGNAPGVAPILAHIRAAMTRVWSALERARWCAAPLILIGFAMMVLGLGSAIALSVVGAVVTALGLRLLADIVDERFLRSAGRRPPRD